MVKVTFFEKPGCAGNARQKAVLLRAGHEVEARDLIGHSWTREELLAFLSQTPVADWFNRSSPRVKSGEIVPGQLEPAAALDLLLADHGLIHRPLMQVGGRREVGFLLNVVDEWIGVRPGDPDWSSGPEGCSRSTGAPCSAQGAGTGAIVNLGRKASG